jgi:hypothetical protein
MRARLLTVVSAVATLVAMVSLAPATLSGQAAAPVKNASPAGAIPRMADGKPDLQGTYDIGTLTPLQRKADTPLVMTADEVGKLERQVAARSDSLNAPIDANRAAPPSGGDGSPGPYGNVGGYNNFWLDPGSRYTTVDGQKRASLLIDPPDGRVPPLTPEAQQRQASRQSRPTSDQAAREEDPGFEGPDAYNDPEIRPLAERCLLGFSSTSGPPMLPTYFYNNLHQIVQTPDRVMILTEMVHDARIVRIGGTHPPQAMKRWLGDSIGRWEGDTLVVETTNFTDNTRFMGSTDNLRVVERFTRVDARTLRYQFTVEDPKTWTRPWTAEYTWPKTNDLMYEYACHEGNYAMGNILRGARLKEKTEGTKSRQ